MFTEEQIKKRMLWIDFTAKRLLDKVLNGLYNKTVFVNLNDKTSLVAKNCEDSLWNGIALLKGIESCIKKEVFTDWGNITDSYFEKNGLCCFSSKEIKENESISWIFFIYVNKTVYDSVNKLSCFDNPEDSDCLPYQIITDFLYKIRDFLFNTEMTDTDIAVKTFPDDIIRHAGNTLLSLVSFLFLDNKRNYTDLVESLNKVSYLNYEKKNIEYGGILFAKRTKPDELQLLMQQVERFFAAHDKIDKSTDALEKLDAVVEANQLADESLDIDSKINQPYKLPGEGINVDYIAVFKEPIELSDSIHIRKLLEITTNDAYLISDSDSVFGLGRLSDKSKDYYRVLFSGYGEWAFYENEKCIFNYKNGMPYIPRNKFSNETFRSLFMSLFGNIQNVKNVVSDYITLINSAIEENFGTVIVITQEACCESKRLAKQAMSIDKVKLDNTNIKRIIKIDGAIIADPEGYCHAFGVILDGIASSKIGTAARGSRYNSSLRYCKTRADYGNTKLLVVVISDDGMVDMISSEECS